MRVIPAAARERQRRRDRASLRRGGRDPAARHRPSLRAALAPDAWAALAPQLGRAGAVTRGRRPTRPQARTLTLADLRRFLECPLQGSVRVLLPMRDEPDAADDAEAALREHENLDETRGAIAAHAARGLARALAAGVRRR